VQRSVLMGVELVGNGDSMKKFKLILCLQRESVYLVDPIDYFIRRLGENFEISKVILFRTNPVGKGGALIRTLFKVFRIFGVWYLLSYSVRHLFYCFKGATIEKMLEAHKLNIYNLEGSINSDENNLILRRTDADLLVSITSNEVFSQRTLDSVRYGGINLHSSLLPSFKGLMPSFWMLLTNERRGGVTVFKMNSGIDTGEILVQKPLNLIPPPKLQTLIRHSKYLGMDCILEALEILRPDLIQPIRHDINHSYFTSPRRTDVAAFRRNGGKFF
jgi:methionyl-tRNA formyltransferase